MAISKLPDKQFTELTESVRKDISELNLAPPTETHDKTKLSLAHRAFKKRCVEAKGHSSYMDIRILLPSSNICETLFSKAGFALNGRQKSLHPSNFEEQMFLYVNRTYWGMKELNAIIK